MKKIKVILSVLLMAAAISFTACSNASSGSDSGSSTTPATTSTPGSGGGSGSGSGGGNQTPAVTYIGSKAPTAAKAVGDIVFTDGSATPYYMVNSLTAEKKQAAIAIIFYVGTDLNNDGDTTTVRTLGVGLKHDKEGRAWCIGGIQGNNNIQTIKSEATTTNSVTTFDGDKNGFDNLIQIASAGANDTGTPGNYPAFYFGKGYKDITGSHVSNTIYQNGWYLPSIAELYYIYLKGKSDSKSFDIDALLQSLEGNKFESDFYWSSTQGKGSSEASGISFENGQINNESNKNYGLGRVCAIRDFTNYTITLNSAANGTVTANKTSAQAGDSITLTGTGTSTVSNDYKVGSFEINGSTISNVTNNTHTFEMPAANVTVNATFTAIVYKGTKRPSVAKEVGDVVFNDGSSTPYSTSLTQEQKNAAIALIFYKGTELNNGNDTTTVRTLGVGLKHTHNIKWCRGIIGSTTSTDFADAAKIIIATIQCTVSGSQGSYTFTGIKNGKNNFDLLAAFPGVSDSATAANYPAFYFAKNYKDVTGTNVSGTAYEDGWYLPSIAELYQIYKCRHDTTNGFNIYAASVELDGGDFNGHNYFSSSQHPTNYNDMCSCTFGDNQSYDGMCGQNFKTVDTFYTCCIREFN